MTVLNQTCAAIQKCGDYWANELSNPSAETNVTGWGVQGGTLTRVTADSRIGAACGENVRTSTASNIAPVPTGTGAIPCSPGDLLYVLASGKQVGGALPSTPLRLRLQFLDSGGAAVGSSLAVNQQMAAVDTWTHFAALAIVPAGAAFVRPFTDWSAGASVTITIHSDRWSVVRNPLRYSVGDLDDFGADSGTWVDSSTGAALTGYTIASGVYTPTTNASRRAVRSDRIRGDGRYAVRFRTGATLAGAGIALVLKADLAGNYLRLEVTPSSGQIAIRRVVGAATALAVVTASALVASTDYWLRAHVVGNLVTMSIWQGSSLGSGTLLSTVSWVLSGADATQFGAGVSGYYGLYHIGGTVTDYTFDDLQYETLTNALPDYFDGDQGAASWEGTAHASRSLLTKYTIAGRLPTRVLSPTQTQAAAPVRAVLRVLSAAQAQSSPLARLLARTAALTQAQTGLLVRSASRTSQLSEATTAAITRATSRALSLTAPNQAGLTRVVSRTVSLTATGQALVARVVQRVRSVTAPIQPRLTRITSRTFSLTGASQARALRAPNPTTRSSQLQSAALRRSPGAVRSALESTVPKIPRRLTVSRAGVEGTAARALRRAGIVRQVANTSSAVARRGPTPRTRATQSTLGRIAKRPGKLAQVLVRATASLVRSSSALRAVLGAVQAQAARISRAPVIRRLGTSSTTARALRSPATHHTATQAQVPRALRGPTPRTRAVQAQAAIRRVLAVKALKRAIAAVPTSSRTQLRTAALTQPAGARVIRSGRRVYLITETGTTSTAKQAQRRRTLAVTTGVHLMRAPVRVTAIVVSLRRALGRVPSIARTSSAITTASTPRSPRRSVVTTAATSARTVRRPGRSRTASQAVLAVPVRSAGKLARRAVAASPTTRRALQRSLAIAEGIAVRLARGRFLQLSAGQPQLATRSRRAGLALLVLQAADALRMTFGLPRPFNQPGQTGYVSRPHAGSAVSGPPPGHVERVRSGRAETIEVP